MSELRIIVVKHGTFERRSDDGNQRTPCEPQELKDLAKLLRNVNAVPEHYFTSQREVAKETAKILAEDIGYGTLSRVEVEGLNPPSSDTESVDHAFEDIIGHASEKHIDLGCGNTVAFVGHETRLSKLITRMTGERFRPLDPLDAICVTGKDLDELRLGRGQVAWRVPVKAFQEEQLRPKVASKMTVATLLGGFSFAALLQLLTETLPKVKNPVSNPSFLSELHAWLPYLALICLGAALGFFIAAVYVYDVLNMPEGFWVDSGPGKHRARRWSRLPGRSEKPADERNRLPTCVRNRRQEYGPLYAHMLYAWTYLFTPGVVLAGLGLLLIAVYSAPPALAMLFAIALAAAYFYYRKVRPQFGVD